MPVEGQNVEFVRAASKRVSEQARFAGPVLLAGWRGCGELLKGAEQRPQSSPETSEGLASAAGSQPSSRSVWLVMGPMEMAATPAKGNAIPAGMRASARCVALDELVKVAASTPFCRAARSSAGADSGTTFR